MKRGVKRVYPKRLEAQKEQVQAVDTVMSMKEINHIRNSTVARDMAENAMNAGYEAGIREVVAKGLKVTNISPEGKGKGIVLFISDNQLREWGV
ncbi:hypothetical protein LCGC14_0561110 [marine sediment metagenome]|uniref:Uncharacterized protein n=1 Tax=marine sediment metagenome TaxID=412755 RepID=A0A0F9RLX8_9ZZZZ